MIAAKSNVMFDHCLLGLQVVLHSQFSFENVEIMYQSNRSLNIPPPPPTGILWTFDVFSCPGRRKFDELSLPGDGVFDHYS